MINKYVLLSAISIIYTTGIFFAGWFARNKFIKPKVQIATKSKIITKPVHRNYNKLPYNDAISELRKYDLGVARLDGYIYNNTFTAKAGLASRNWTRDFKLKISESSNFNFYLGLTLGTIATVGVIYAFQRLH